MAADDPVAAEHRRATQRVVDALVVLMRRWERQARMAHWPEELQGGLMDVQALRRIDHDPGISAGELARSLWMAESAVTAVLNRLEAAGLIVRQRASRDRRVVRLVLTDRGKALLEETERMHLDQVSRRFSALSVEDLDQLANLLAKMAHSDEEKEGG
jgi:DNA-binding MarR family transcriptional regulator